jgi:hypothetical protein
MIDDRARLLVRLDDLVAAIDLAERRGQRLRVNALILEWELLAGQLARLALEDRLADESR